MLDAVALAFGVKIEGLKIFEMQFGLWITRQMIQPRTCYLRKEKKKCRRASQLSRKSSQTLDNPGNGTVTLASIVMTELNPINPNALACRISKYFLERAGTPTRKLE